MFRASRCHFCRPPPWPLLCSLRGAGPRGGFRLVSGGFPRCLLRASRVCVAFATAGGLWRAREKITGCTTSGRKCQHVALYQRAIRGTPPGPRRPTHEGGKAMPLKNPPDSHGGVVPERGCNGPRCAETVGVRTFGGVGGRIGTMDQPARQEYHQDGPFRLEIEHVVRIDCSVEVLRMGIPGENQVGWKEQE